MVGSGVWQQTGAGSPAWLRILALYPFGSVTLGRDLSSPSTP